MWEMPPIKRSFYYIHTMLPLAPHLCCIHVPAVAYLNDFLCNTSTAHLQD